MATVVVQFSADHVQNREHSLNMCTLMIMNTSVYL
jgi:hypothetical protein